MKEMVKQKNTEPRPPVIVVMGHIDHGKSTLLDYIRKTNVVDKESGGITQHISSYEVLRDKRKITFLDTPGHEAFSSVRECGVCAADIAILVVSAEDGVKAQTIEVLKIIHEAKIPFVVAINKIDKQGANVEKTKQGLAENDIYLEGYGGNIPYALISAKTGDGVKDLLDTVLLVSDIEELVGDKNKHAEGIVLETNIDKQKGISATLVIKDGTLKKRQFAVSGNAISTIRIIEDFLGNPIDEANFSSPVRVIGWDKMPAIGGLFKTFDTKKEAEQISKIESAEKESDMYFGASDAKTIIPLIIKTDVSGSLEAIKNELRKIYVEQVAFKIIGEGTGAISDNDIKTGKSASLGALVIGFNVGIDKRALHSAEQSAVLIKTFNVIYDISVWLLEETEKRKPKTETEETLGIAKILRVFNTTKNKQVLGGRVISGKINISAPVKIFRRDYLLGRGKIIELQQAKMPAKEILEENEFGIMIESKIEIAEGDMIEAFHVIIK